MKRTLLLVLVFALFAVTACGDGEEDKKKGVEESLADYGVGEIAAAAGLEKGLIYSSLGEEQKEALESAAALQGAEVSYCENGDTVFTFADDGGVVTQHSDGKYSFATQGAADNTVTLGDDWAGETYAKYTGKLPKPAFEVLGVSEINGSFNATFNGVNKDDALEYAEQLADGGFDVGALAKETGDSYYSYEAQNAAGDEVKLSFVGAVITLKLTLGK